MGFIKINEDRRDLIIGFLAGLLINALAILAYALIFSKFGVRITLLDAYYKGYLGKLIVLGGALDPLVFFIFLNRNKNESAQGASITSTVSVFVILSLQFI